MQPNLRCGQSISPPNAFQKPCRRLKSPLVDLRLQGQIIFPLAAQYALKECHTCLLAYAHLQPKGLDKEGFTDLLIKSQSIFTNKAKHVIKER